MGIPNSKVVTDTKSDISLAEINTPSTTLSSTPPKSIDPRSPSADIARTPIENIPSLLSIFPECKLVPSNVEENDIIDSEINKTPISIKQNSFKVDKDIRRKLLKDSALKIIEKTDKITALCDEIIESNTSESLSDTSLTEMINTPDKFKMKVGLLETDIDFIETDIDQVYQKSHKPGLSYATPRDILHAKLKKQMENNADMNILQLMDPRSPTVGIDRTPVQVIKPLDIDPRSPTVEFERTPIQIPLKSYKNIRTNEIVVDVENFEQKLDILCITDSEDEKCKSDDSFDRVMSKEKSVSERSLEKIVLPKRNLIYEDEECSTPTRKIQNLKQNEGNGRTPLGVRNGNGAHCRSKSANGRLPSEQKINKNDLKNAYAVSKIPVFNKNVKKIRGKIQQCENTPPMNLNDMKLSKRAQWDSDSTMII